MPERSTAVGLAMSLPGDVRGRAVYRFEDGALVAEVRARHQSQPADKCRAQVGDDVAVKIFQQQDVVLVGIHHQLHAGVVHDVLAVGDLGILLGDVTRAADEQPVRQLHDVGFVDGVDLLAMDPPRVFEGEARDARGSLLGDDLQALHHARHHFVLDAGVQALGVLANHDQVHARDSAWPRWAGCGWAGSWRTARTACAARR